MLAGWLEAAQQASPATTAAAEVTQCAKLRQILAAPQWRQRRRQVKQQLSASSHSHQECRSSPCDSCLLHLLVVAFTTRAIRHQLHELFENVGDEAPPPPGRDVSAEQWLRSKGASELQMEVADVCYANDFGCSVQQLGLREMIVENNK
jgi:hypothetical protein